MSQQYGREIIFDTETTGLSPAEDRVFEIGAVEMENRIPTGNTFQMFLDPEQELSAESVRITGVKNEQLLGQPRFFQIVDEWLAFIGDATLVAHNASFDMGFMNAELERCGRPPLQNEVVDTLVLARQKLPGARHTLDALCRRYNVDLSVRTVHGALLDSQLLAEVYVELTGGLQGNFIMDQAEKSDEQAANTGDSLAKVTMQRTQRVVQPHAEELKNHEKFLEKFVKESLW